jgi:hypothetical protein
MLEQIDAVTIEFLKRITFIVGYPTAYWYICGGLTFSE